MNTNTASAAEILAEVEDAFGAVFERIQWAEDEITQAQRRHPAQADRIYHAFSLLSGGEASGRMSVEAVYRAHARELLERVAADEDTRPGTAVEVVIGLLAAAELGPLTHEGFALCARLWLAAGLPDHDEFADRIEHLEALHADRIDREEAGARRACRDDARKITRPDCDGMHHGAHVTCTYATAAPAAA